MIGSVSDGVNLHDIVRDFTLASRTPVQLKQLQQSFVDALLSSVGAVLPGKMAVVARQYALHSLSYHFQNATTLPLSQDAYAKAKLLRSATTEE